MAMEHDIYFLLSAMLSLFILSGDRWIGGSYAGDLNIPVR